MHPSILEACYKKYMLDIAKWLPDGVIEVNLDLLNQLKLLHFHNHEVFKSPLTRYFHVVESDEKLTLANEEFIVWIVPEKLNLDPVTYTFIALNQPDGIHLELAFMTMGIYNHSHLVLRVLEKYLVEIQNTENLISKLS